MVNRSRAVRVLVLSRGPSSAWICDVLGFGPGLRTVVSEDWQVLDALAEGGFDLVVADAHGPGRVPVALVAMVRATGRTTPFLLIADRVDERQRAHAARLGDVALIERGALAAPATSLRAGS